MADPTEDGSLPVSRGEGLVDEDEAGWRRVEAAVANAHPRPRITRRAIAYSALLMVVVCVLARFAVDALHVPTLAAAFAGAALGVLTVKAGIWLDGRWPR